MRITGLTPAFYWDGGFPQNFSHPPLISPTVANGQSATIVQKLPAESSLIHNSGI